jgi:acyl-CoA thioesterase-1
LKRGKKSDWTGRAFVRVLSVLAITAFIFSVLAIDAWRRPALASPTFVSPAHKDRAERPGKEIETVIVFIGDSLTQGYGVRAEEAYPELVGKQLRERGYAVKIINGGISGSVTAEADRRLRWYLKAKPQIVVIALGANDGMKGTPPDVIEKNLVKVIELAKQNHIEVVLAGLKMFTNLGESYLRKYESIFPRLARNMKVELIPFFIAIRVTKSLERLLSRNAKGGQK